MQSPVPAFVNSLTALSKILDKAEAHAEAKKIKPEVIPHLRLVADMLPFTAQINIACDHAKGASARLAGVEVPSFARPPAHRRGNKPRLSSGSVPLPGRDGHRLDVLGRIRLRHSPHFSQTTLFKSA